MSSMKLKARPKRKPRIYVIEYFMSPKIGKNDKEKIERLREKRNKLEMKWETM